MDGESFVKRVAGEVAAANEAARTLARILAASAKRDVTVEVRRLAPRIVELFADEVLREIGEDPMG